MSTLSLMLWNIAVTGCSTGGGSFIPDNGLTRCGSPISTLSPTVEQQGRLELVKDFPSSTLGNTRTLRIYLPENYNSTAGNWPVLYMHDGQNLFDAQTAAYGVEWQVDENVDSLTASGAMSPVIVVGIDNTSDRIAEYTPTQSADYGGGKGELYTQFVVNEVMPYIETHYSVACGNSNTAIMGSSLGGLISFYMGWTRPEVFGMAGAVSPSFWWDNQWTLRDLQQYSGKKKDLQLWIDIGTGEGEDDDGDGLSSAVEDARAVRDQLLGMGYSFGTDQAYQEVYGGGHNETAWAARVHNPLLSFFGTNPQPELTGLAVQPYSSSVGLTGITTAQVEVNLEYANGLQLTVPNPLASLAVADPSLAAVTSEGVVTGKALGTTEITAAYGGRSAGAPIEVVQTLSGDVTLTFDVTVPANTPSSDTVYIVGNVSQLGEWNPAAVPMTRGSDGHWTLALSFARNTEFEYKYTRGSWNNVEKDSSGAELSNRSGRADETKTVSDTVARWADIP